jgi:hypothetical protein
MLWRDLRPPGREPVETGRSLVVLAQLQVCGDAARDQAETEVRPVGRLPVCRGIERAQRVGRPVQAQIAVGQVKGDPRRRPAAADRQHDRQGRLERGHRGGMMTEA